MRQRDGFVRRGDAHAERGGREWRAAPMVVRVSRNESGMSESHVAPGRGDDVWTSIRFTETPKRRRFGNVVSLRGPRIIVVADDRSARRATEHYGGYLILRIDFTPMTVDSLKKPRIDNTM